MWYHGLFSEQMYKKRFAKWRFHRNSRPAGPKPPTEMPASPRFSRDDTLTLTVLTSVRTWSVAYYESWMQSTNSLRPSSPDKLPAHLSKDVNYSFKLVADLLRRGRGKLAGRVARKGFVLLEDMLRLESPALVWNLLEMMHHMAKLRHARLFQLLVTHLLALAGGQMPETHPLLAMLRGMRGLVAGSRSLLERAWIHNAETVVANFDLRLSRMYFRINWDGCSIDPPHDLVGRLDQCFTRIQVQGQDMLSAAALAHGAEETSMTQRPLSQSRQEDSPPPRIYEILRVKSIAALRERKDSILQKWPSVDRDNNVSLRMLSSLAAVNILEGSSSVIDDWTTPWATRLHAGNVACAIRTLIDVDEETTSRASSELLDTVERMRAVVVLREYSKGEANPQTVQEMWLLQDALIAAGKYDEAQEVERDAYRRIEMYVQGIPSDSV